MPSYFTVTLKTTAVITFSFYLCLPPAFQVLMLHRDSIFVISAELSQVTYRHTPFGFFQLIQLSLGWGKTVFSPPGKIHIDHLMIPLPVICIRGKCSYYSFMLAWTKISAMYRLRIKRALQTASYKHTFLKSFSRYETVVLCSVHLPSSILHMIKVV